MIICGLAVSGLINQGSIGIQCTSSLAILGTFCCWECTARAVFGRKFFNFHQLRHSLSVTQLWSEDMFVFLCGPETFCLFLWSRDSLSFSVVSLRSFFFDVCHFSDFFMFVHVCQICQDRHICLSSACCYAWLGLSCTLIGGADDDEPQLVIRAWITIGIDISCGDAGLSVGMSWMLEEATLVQGTYEM